MPRIRSIKPESCLSETLAGVSERACLLFAYLPCFCDDEGRMKYSPKLVKVQVFPLRDEIGPSDCERVVAELVMAGLVVVYEDGGKAYLQVRNFKEHQHPQKAKPSSIPEPTPEGAHQYMQFFAEMVGRPKTTVDIPVREPSDSGIATVDIPVNPENQDGNTGISNVELMDIPVQDESDTGIGSREEKSREGDKDTSANANALSEVLSGSPRPKAGEPPEYADMRRQVIAHLNAVTGSHFRPNSKETSRKHLNARFREGYTVDDCKRVIDAKAAEWMGNPKMRQYLRPETLFCSHFEGYLSEADRRAPEDEELGRYSFSRRGA